MTFGIYLIGYALFIIGLGYGAYLMHIPAQWIAVGVIILVGIGIFTGVSNTRQKDTN